jgi:hypothetical protein
MKDYKNRNSTLYVRQRKRWRLGPVLAVLALIAIGILVAMSQLQTEPAREGRAEQAPSENNNAIPLALPPPRPSEPQPAEAQ